MPNIIQDIELACDLIKQGQLVAIPTETVYGLAADAAQDEAIAKVFQQKGRPQTHPVILHISPDWDLSQWVEYVPDYAQRLIERFWPGPLTLIFKMKPGAVSLRVTGGQDTIAIRAPSHPITLALLEQLSRPVVAPSANPFGKISPTTAQHVAESFKDSALAILEGGRCEVGIESTIVLATNLQGPKILRAGVISEQEIAEVAATQECYLHEEVRAPGHLSQHYQPKKPLFSFQKLVQLHNFIKSNPDEVYVLSFSHLEGLPYHYQFSDDVQQVAFELYYQLRVADDSNAKCIAVELPPNQSYWRAITERIIKAGQVYIESSGSPLD